MASVATGLIEKIQIDTNAAANIASTAYGICDTAASTAAKVVEITGFELVEGVTIHVKFSYSNSASSPTLQVKYGPEDTDITDPKYIVLYGTTKASTSSTTTGWQQDAVVSLTYDGNYWVRDQGYNTNSTYSALTVADAWTGTATTSRTITAAGLKAIFANLGGTSLALTHDSTNGIVLDHIGGDGNLHVPATGTTNDGKFLKAGSTAGSISWATLVKSDISDFAHVHGNITNAGAIGNSTNWELDENDGLLVFDASNGNKIEKSAILFDGVTETKGLTPSGTWVNYAGGTRVTLNDTDKSKTTASFYAPTTAGSEDQLLVSTEGEPAWLSDDIGDKYTPTYVNQGVLTEASVTQQKAFTIAINSTGTVLVDNAYCSDTYVLEIVVTSGAGGLHGPIEWESFSADDTTTPPTANSIKLTTVATTEAVSGYIITARGETLN